ncbi:HNH endonuclease [Streptomyces yunnanensis]|uniref:HNH endonuclease n=1 Tax=Streptomyces yunnanensis TaxID=156453 RepID=UPI003B82D8C5
MVCIREGCTKPATREGRCPGHQREPFRGSAWRTQRPAGWTSTRRKVLIRDRGVCDLCGGTGATEVDHLVPLARGGSHDMSNLRSLHKECHRNKTQKESRHGG